MVTGSLRSLALALLSIGGIAAAPARAAALEPVPVFTQVCVQGGGKMAAGSLAPRRYLALPVAARVALGIGKPGIDWRSGDLFAPLGPGQVPNIVDAVGQGGDTVLLVPAAGRGGALASSCVVLWKGRHFDAARQAIRDITGLDRDDDSRVAGAQRIDVTGEGFRIAAAEAQGWTMLRATPDATAHAEPAAPDKK